MLSIVIVNWNGWNHLNRALASIAQHSPTCEHEIIVVDNASDDGSVAGLKAHWPSVRVVENTSNAGFAKGCNRGLAHLSPLSTRVLFLNPDAEVQSGTLTRLLAYLEQHTNVGAVTCSLLNESGEFQQAQGHRLPSPWSTFNQYLFFNRIISDRLFPGTFWAHRPKGTVTVEWISGALMMVRREAISDGRFFDESYFMYAEDMEASLELRKKGWTCAFMGDVSAVHALKTSTRKSPKNVFSMQIENHFVFLRRHQSFLSVLFQKCVMLIGFSIRYALARNGEHIRHIRTLLKCPA